MTLALLLATIALTACGDGADTPTTEAEPTASASPSAPSVAVWAANVCALAETLSQTAASDGVDASTLTLEERKARSERIDAVWMPALSAFHDALSAVAVPAEVVDYHAALLAEADGARVAMQEAQSRIANATSVVEIEAANAEMGIASAALGENVRAAALALPAEAQAALRSVTRCGAIVP